MSSIPSIAALERQLTYAKQRQQRLTARQQQAPKVGTRGRQPRESVKYSSIFEAGDYVISAPRVGIAFFGGLAALGLAEPDDSSRAPRGFKPAKILAVRSKSDPARKVAFSGRPYLKYTPDDTKAGQISYSAPISADGAATLKTRIQAIMRAKTDDVGEYGRIYFEPERPVYSVSGEGAAPAAPVA